LPSAREVQADIVQKGGEFGEALEGFDLFGWEEMEGWKLSSNWCGGEP
jgi:hypothetical protein